MTADVASRSDSDGASPDAPNAADAPAAPAVNAPGPDGSDAGASDGSAPVDDETLWFEAKRKALHLLALVVPLLMGILGKPTALALLVPSAALGLAADVWRAYSPGFNRFIRRLFGPLMRGTELPPVGTGVRVNGATCVLIGAALTTWIFPLHVAVPVFAMFMIADAAAALVGRRFGRTPWLDGPRTVEGSFAFVAAGCVVMAFFPALPTGVSLAAVLTAAAAEAAPLPVNDNIRVPLAGCAVVAALHVWWLGQPVDFFL